MNYFIFSEEAGIIINEFIKYLNKANIPIIIVKNENDIKIFWNINQYDKWAANIVDVCSWNISYHRDCKFNHEIHAKVINNILKIILDRAENERKREQLDIITDEIIVRILIKL